MFILFAGFLAGRRAVARLGGAGCSGLFFGHTVADGAVANVGGEYRIRGEVDARAGEEWAAQVEHPGADSSDHEADDEQRGHADAEQQE